MSLSGRILVGLLVGVVTGLFFGELVADLKLVGDIFVKLLQITVLPYIIVSLIAGFGRMQMQQARQLALRGTAVLLVIWGLALSLIFVAAMAFPDIETASFFSAPSRVEADQPDLLELYLPANIFYSLSNNLVPAVVLFSILVGVALIQLEDKSRILPVFDGLAEAMARINTAMVKLTPYGIFAIAAAAAGTMTIEELSRVQVYLVTYISLALLVTFWIFPGLVATLSGIPYREVLSSFRDALVTAFATGNQFVVLPQIAENAKQLLARHHAAGRDTESAVDIIVPVSFNFPSLGKLLVLLFVLFAAWFTDTQVAFLDRLALAFGGLFSLFGSINVAVPYMLNSLQIPSDMFQLFLVTGIVVGRFGAMLAALHIVVLAVIGPLAVAGRLRLRWMDLGRYLLVSAAALFAMVLVLQMYFRAFVPPPPPRDEVLSNIELLVQRVPARIVTDVPEASVTQLAGTRLDHILSTGALQVGYRPNNLPCSYITPKGDLVGFDVEMAHMLAQDLEVKLEFVPFEFDGLRRMLASGQIDIAMSCVASLPDRYADASFSRPYLDLAMAFVTRDHQREVFSDIQTLKAWDGLTIALVSSSYYEARLRRLLPDVRFVYLEAAEDFFTGRDQGAHALLLTEEEGAAYAYRYPHYGVVTTAKRVGMPAAYPVPKGDLEMVEFVSNWIQLKRSEGTIERLYHYWMRGGATADKTPRWSVIRDVLGWVD
ncbi:cation:dicarboxylase symporter family transporter [Seongchinamella unica]|uniref:Cation:dicarboxylase symporter family transporter n=1 Tax=Seongchinamella unica TaxID=2547392 RepID=A0A4R5LUF8_9GAMM|nr:cation:dicarboxylase symporter family transporter [Seongchinamella unica]TDG14828.1 cation:dicarboxylase symporter family transporter [Seongchinamella unica]